LNRTKRPAVAPAQDIEPAKLTASPRSLISKLSKDVVESLAAAGAVTNPSVIKFLTFALKDILLELVSPGFLSKALSANSRQLGTDNLFGSPLTKNNAFAEDHVFELIENREGLKPTHLKNEKRISVPEAQTAMAKCEAVTRIWNPTVIVSVNAGGDIVGNYLRHRIGLDRDRLLQAKLTKKAGSLRIAITRKIQRNSRILVVDDVIRSGTTMRSVYGHLRTEFPHTPIQCVTLVASEQAMESKAWDIPCYSSNYTTSLAVSFPWETHGEVLLNDGIYVIGRGKNSIAMTENEAELSYREVSDA